MKKKKSGKQPVKIGRPTKYRDEFPDMLEKHMAKGLSIEAFAGVISISKDTIYRWVDEKKGHKAFSDAFKRGKAKTILYWESFVKKAAKGQRMQMKDEKTGEPIFDEKGNPVYLKPNVPLLIFVLKNQIGWEDKVTIKEKTETRKSFKLNYSLDKKPKED
jgi:transposase